MRKRTRNIAFCGILGALGVALMLLGGISGVATYASPVLAAFLLIGAEEECGTKSAFLLYVIITVLSLLLCTDKEAAALFLCFGYYPLIRGWFERIPSAVLRILAKLLYFNLIVAVLYLFLCLVLRLPDIRSDMETIKGVMLALFAVLVNVVAVLADLLIPRLRLIYTARIRPKLFHGR